MVVAWLPGAVAWLPYGPFAAPRRLKADLFSSRVLRD